MIKLSHYQDQAYNQDKAIGHMRFDFASGGKLANSFVGGGTSMNVLIKHYFKRN